LLTTKALKTLPCNFFGRLCQEDERIRMLQYPGSFSRSATDNVAAREACGEILLLANNDIRVIEVGWLTEMISRARRPDVGIVGAKPYYPAGQIQHAGVVLRPGGIRGIRTAPTQN
jgi:hypothetical protein